ncbi:unnamed protein product [Scytosiphon promiscuus]
MVRTCGHEGCLKQPTFGIDGSKKKEFCSPHAKEGMVNIHTRRCRKLGCMKSPGYGVAGTRVALYCRRHAEGTDMVAVRKKTCADPECTKSAIFGAAGTKNGQYCSTHREAGMVDVVSKRCGHPGGCNTHASYGVAGSGKPEFCSRHAAAQMVNVFIKACAHQDCRKKASWAAAGAKKPEFCWEHCRDGMVNILPRKSCAEPDCTKTPSYAKAGTRQREYCQSHAKDGMVSIKPECAHPSCSTSPTYGEKGSKAEFCAKHKDMKPGLISVHRRSCKNKWCSALPVYAAAGSRTAQFCPRHAAEGMINMSRTSKSRGEAKVYTPTPIMALPQESPPAAEEAQDKDSSLLKAKNFLQQQQQQVERQQLQEQQQQQQPQLERLRGETNVARTSQVFERPGDRFTQGQAFPNLGSPLEGGLLPRSGGIQQEKALSAGEGYVQRWPLHRVVEQPRSAIAFSASTATGGPVCQPQGGMRWAIPAAIGWMRCSGCGRAGHLLAECPNKGAAFFDVAGAASYRLMSGMSPCLFPSVYLQNSVHGGEIPAQVGGGGGGYFIPPQSPIPNSYTSHAVGSVLLEGGSHQTLAAEHFALSARDKPAAPGNVAPRIEGGNASKRARVTAGTSQEVPTSARTTAGALSTETAGATAGVAAAAARAIPGEGLPVGGDTSPEATDTAVALEDGSRVQQEYKEEELAVPGVKEEGRERQRPTMPFAKRGNLRHFF